MDIPVEARHGAATLHKISIESNFTMNNEDLLDSMMPGMAKEAGATEDLKAHDPMRWVGLMNCCKTQVEEIIFAELIYY